MSTAIHQAQAPARRQLRSVALAVGVLALACSGAAQAQSHGGWHGGGGHGGGGHGGGWHGGGHYYRGGGWGYAPLWGLGLGIGLGLATSPYYYDSPGYVVLDRPDPYYYAPPARVAVYQAPAQPVAPAAPPAADPIFYPRNNQSSDQVEADRQACNRWATGYPKAMEDASIFHRATLACMDGRGYTAR